MPRYEKATIFQVVERMTFLQLSQISFSHRLDTDSIMTGSEKTAGVPPMRESLVLGEEKTISS